MNGREGAIQTQKAHSQRWGREQLPGWGQRKLGITVQQVGLVWSDGKVLEMENGGVTL